jgi:hypothetical protein
LDPIDAEELRLAVGAVAGHVHHHHDDQTPARAEPAHLAPAPGWVRHPGSLQFQAAALAGLLALVGAFVPSITLAAVLAGLGLVLGGALVGRVVPGVRAFAVAFVASLGAGLLLVPWTFELLLPGATWAGFAGFGRAATDAPGLAEIVRFGVGPFGRSPLAWGFLVAAALPLVVGRRWRFEWAARLWMVAGAGWAVSWALGRGWLGVDPPAVDVLLAPAAAALVLAAVLGLSAFEIDLPAYQFGWRQLASLVAAGAAAVATVPVLAGTIDGRWRIPERDVPQLLSWMPEQVADGEFRVLWAGDPEALPLDGWRLADGVAYGSSRNGPPDVTTLWPAADQGSTGLLRDALDVARRGETSRLGHLLAPLGVRYVVVPLRAGPARDGGRAVDRPDDVLASLRAQIDLRLIEGDESVVVYENAAWAPIATVLPAPAVEASRTSGPDAARTTELGGAPPAFPRTGTTSYAGPWAGPELYLAEAYSSRWSFGVEAGDADATQRKAFGWANAWTAPAAPSATLSYSTSPLRYAALLMELGLWVGLVRALILGVRERISAVAS